MTYRVIVSPQAQRDIRQSFRYIHDRAPLNANRWLRTLWKCIATLEKFPHRCSPARENDYFDEDLQQLLFMSHRIVFWISDTGKAVHVLFVRHTKQG